MTTAKTTSAYLLVALLAFTGLAAGASAAGTPIAYAGVPNVTTGSITLFDANDNAKQDLAVVEGGIVAFQACITSATTSDVGFSYTLTGSATSADYTTPNGGVLTGTIGTGATCFGVSVTTIDDAVAANDAPLESLIFTLQANGLGSGAQAGTLAQRTATVWILDNDNSPLVSVGTGIPVLEDDSATADQDLVFPLSLSAPTAHDVTAKLTTTAAGTALSDAAAPANPDYKAITTGVTGTVAAGHLIAKSGLSGSKVAVYGDLRHELTQTVGVQIASPTGAALGTTTAVGAILDNDALPSISLNDVSANEGNAGNTAFVFQAKLSQAQELDMSCKANTGSLTATSVSDFVPLVNQVVAIAKDTTTATVTVQVKGDVVVESTEQFKLVLSGCTNLNAGKNDFLGVGTIVNDEANPNSVGISFTDGIAKESTTDTATLRLTRTGDLFAPLTVNIRFTGTALDGNVDATEDDYTVVGTPGMTLVYTGGGATADYQVTIPAGKKTANVTIKADHSRVLDEPTETVIATLMPGAGYAGLGIVVAQIQDSADDVLPTLHLEDSDAKPTDGLFTSDLDCGYTDEFTVVLSGPSGQTVRVAYKVEKASGTATAPFEMVAPDALSGVLTFGPYETTNSIAVQSLAPGTYKVTILTPTLATLGGGPAVEMVKIVDFDGFC